MGLNGGPHICDKVARDTAGHRQTPVVFPWNKVILYHIIPCYDSSNMEITIIRDTNIKCLHTIVTLLLKCYFI